MRVEDLILVSIDDHIVEPPNMFDRHVPDRWKDQAPRLIIDDRGFETWTFQGVTSTSVGLNAVVSWPKEEWGFEPASIGEMRPGAWNVDERVRDMNRNGILASMCFPSFAGFNARFFHESKDHDLALIMLKAYNDWHIDEWCGSHPGRFIPLGIAPVWSSTEMAAEVRRLSSKGCKAISMPELPHLMGLPSYHDMEYWAPFFEAASEEQVVMCLHIGQGFAALKTAPDGPIDNFMILATQISVIAAQDLLWGPAMRRYPDLKIAWSESGIGWIPFFLDRCDRHYTNQIWIGNDFGGKLPSEVFREHSLACFVTDRTALKVRHDIGMDMIAWECDFPHSDCVFPDAPEQILDEMTSAGCTDEEMHKITWKNTANFFQVDPFSRIPREKASVGALRALTPDVDTQIRSRQEWRGLHAERMGA